MFAEEAAQWRAPPNPPKALLACALQKQDCHAAGQVLGGLFVLRRRRRGRSKKRSSITQYVERKPLNGNQ